MPGRAVFLRGVRLAALAALVGAAAACCSAAPALGAAGDVAATHSYVQAEFALARAGVGLIGTAQARIERLNSELAHRCPKAGAGSPQDEAAQSMSALVVVAEWSIAYGTNAGPIRRFSAAVARLHWSSSALTRAAQRYAASLREMVALPLPDLCRAVRSWTASGFTVIPPGVAGLVAHAEAITLTPVSPGALARLAQGADAGTLARARALEQTLAEAEFTHGENDTFQLLGTLGLQE